MEQDKKLKNFIKTTIREFLNEGNLNNLKIDDLVNKKFYIELGTSSVSTTWDRDSLIKKISGVILHNLFDRDFYYNWTDKKEEYYNIFKETTLTPMIADINNTLNKYFELKTPPYPRVEEAKLFFKQHNNQLWIDNWFQTNETISDELKNDYYRYRQEYAGVSLK
jgi:hypothetical protein